MHILALGGYTEAHLRLIESENVKITLFTLTSHVKKYNKNLYQQIITFEDFANQPHWLEFAKLVNSHTKIDSVITFFDNLQQLALTIAQNFSCYYSYNTTTIELFNNKFKLRQLLQQQKFETVLSSEVTSEQSIKKFFTSHPTVRQAIVKPIDGSGSQSIFKIKVDDNIPEFYHSLSPLLNNTKFIIEEFLTGKEFSVESYSEDGQHKIYGITEKFKDDHFVEIGHNIPAIIDNSLEQAIKNYIQQFLTITKVKNGPVHTEIMVTEQEIRLIESQARIGGGMINELYSLVYAIDILKLVSQGSIGIKVITQIPEFSLHNFKCYAASRFKPSFTKPYTVTDIIVDHKFITQHNFKYKAYCEIGEQLKVNNNSFGKCTNYC